MLENKDGGLSRYPNGQQGQDREEREGGGREEEKSSPLILSATLEKQLQVLLAFLHKRFEAEVKQLPPGLHSQHMVGL